MSRAHWSSYVCSSHFSLPATAFTLTTAIATSALHRAAPALAATALTLTTAIATAALAASALRVGTEGRSRWTPDHKKKKRLEE